MKRFALWSCIFTLLLTAPAIAAKKLYDVPIGDSPQRGPADAKVTIVEFIDYQ